MCPTTTAISWSATAISWSASAFSRLLTMVMAVLALVLGVSGDEYRYGRATNYWDNNQGSCHFKDVYSMKWYAAWPDTLDGFSGSCGKCFEVQCMKKDFHDGYGEYMSRWFACRDENKRVVVKITDSCPCVHANAYSNKRWCCGDMPHLDLGNAAFKELADEKWGVIAIKWKEVSCDKLGPQN